MVTGQSYSGESRIERVKRKLSIDDAVVRAGVKLTGSNSSTRRRAKCPFHSGNSASFSIMTGGSSPENGFGHCFGCGWHGDVVAFVRDHMGLSFPDALAECERMAGISSDGAQGEARGPVQRSRAPAAKPERDLVSVVDMARWIWAQARPNPEAVRRYFIGRGVPDGVLDDGRLTAFRVLADCPISQWEVGKDPRKGLIAPALIGMVCRPDIADDGLTFKPVALHVTFMNPDGTGTMIRRKPWAKPDDPDPLFAKRKMLGPVKGGCVLLGRYSRNAHLFVGEGNETVLSGMALAKADNAAVGVATLSLDNLQGGVRYRGQRIWPLFAIEPDAEKPAFAIPGHAGRVTGLIDSDMAPLRGMRDQRRGGFIGEAVIERKGAPIINREITGAERARICAELFVKRWRGAGVHQVQAMRAPLGMDFNDAAKAAGKVV